MLQSYNKAYEIFQNGLKGEKGMLCLYRLAMMTRNGQGCAKDITKGIEMLKEAADNGDCRARFQIGIDYYTGKDIDINYTHAVKCLESALTDKNLFEDARRNIYRILSTCYRFGRGVNANESKANEYFSEATRYGNSDAIKIHEWLFTNNVE